MQRFTTQQIENLLKNLIEKTLSCVYFDVNKRPYITCGKVIILDNFFINWSILFSNEKDKNIFIANSIKLQITEIFPPKREHWERRGNCYPDEDFNNKYKYHAANYFNLTNSALRLPDDIPIQNGHAFRIIYSEFLKIITDFLKS